MQEKRAVGPCNRARATCVNSRSSSPGRADAGLGQARRSSSQDRNVRGATSEVFPPRTNKTSPWQCRGPCCRGACLTHDWAERGSRFFDVFSRFEVYEVVRKPRRGSGPAWIPLPAPEGPATIQRHGRTSFSISTSDCFCVYAILFPGSILPFDVVESRPGIYY